MPKKLVIAIDGPVGVGKGTLTVALAEKLGIPSVYTGGMYRALALACLQLDADIYDEKRVLEVLNQSSIKLETREYGTGVFLNDNEVSNEIFLPEISKIVHIVASYKSVRKEMVLRQQEIIKDRSVIIEGRDIATDVAPFSDLKIYLTATIEVRAKRRFEQFKEKGVNIGFDEVLEDLENRDKADIERETSPLKKVPDAWVLDTTDLSIEETVEIVLEKIKEKNLL